MPEEHGTNDVSEATSSPPVRSSYRETAIDFPFRIQVNFTAAGRSIEELSEIIDSIVDEGEQRGFFFEYGYTQEMPMEQVIPGSPLYQAITGERR
jgi:hypothetical protein